MGAAKPSGAGWQQVQIAVRSDILTAAEQRDIDIGDACNRALAIRLGIVYPSEPAKKKTPGVIIAQAPAPQGAEKPAHTASPVINADDPATPGKVIKERKEKKVPPKEKPQPAPVPVPAVQEKAPAPAQPAKKKPARPGKKEDAIQRFVSTILVRETEESPDAIIGKDELYERFIRWCREHGHKNVPDRRTFTVSLKNKYAFGERTINGIPSWYGIRIK